MIVYAVVDDVVETFIRHDDADRFVEEVRGDEPELARYLRIEERGCRLLRLGGRRGNLSVDPRKSCSPPGLTGVRADPPVAASGLRNP
jgi:hypothetical protein